MRVRNEREKSQRLRLNVANTLTSIFFIDNWYFLFSLMITQFFHQGNLRLQVMCSVFVCFFSLEGNSFPTFL